MTATFSPSVSSAVAKWVMSPATTIASPAAIAASISPERSSGRAPNRPIPVSSFRWILGRRPALAPASRARSTACGVHATTSAPTAMARSHSPPARGPITRMGAPSPAARRTSASLTAATASDAAPPSSAARATSKGPIGVGSTAHEASVFLGRHLEVDSTIVEFVPDRTLGYATTGGPFPFRGAFLLEPLDGGTRLRATFDAPLSGALRIVDPVFAVIARRKLMTDLVNLKRLLESGAIGGP